jgi:NAD(P)-dependent dehydrogenase (short-subunit alcohol dehydrogenase family)
MQLFDLRGKIAIVTGSTKGIGLGIVERLVEHGARVTVSSRHQDECEKLAADINQRCGEERAFALAADQTDADSLRTLIETSAAHWGGIDIFVGNAVLASMGRIGRVQPQDFTDALQANVSHNALLVNLVVPHMKQRGGGSIIFLASTAAIAAMPDYPVYGAAKAALKHLTSILAVDLGPDNIRVNAIAPGIIRAESTRAMWTDPEAMAIAVGKTPLQRIGEPDEIAACVVFLASAGGAFATGQTFVIDGGQTLRGADGIHDMMQMLRARKTKLS